MRSACRPGRAPGRRGGPDRARPADRRGCGASRQRARPDLRRRRRGPGGDPGQAARRGRHRGVHRGKSRLGWRPHGGYARSGRARPGRGVARGDGCGPRRGRRAGQSAHPPRRYGPGARRRAERRRRRRAARRGPGGPRRCAVGGAAPAQAGRAVRYLPRSRRGRRRVVLRACSAGEAGGDRGPDRLVPRRPGRGPAGGHQPRGPGQARRELARRRVGAADRVRGLRGARRQLRPGQPASGSSQRAGRTLRSRAAGHLFRQLGRPWAGRRVAAGHRGHDGSGRTSAGRPWLRTHGPRSGELVPPAGAAHGRAGRDAAGRRTIRGDHADRALLRAAGDVLAPAGLGRGGGRVRPGRAARSLGGLDQAGRRTGAGRRAGGLPRRRRRGPLDRRPGAGPVRRCRPCWWACSSRAC